MVLLFAEEFVHTDEIVENRNLYMRIFLHFFLFTTLFLLTRPGIECATFPFSLSSRTDKESIGDNFSVIKLL